MAVLTNIWLLIFVLMIPQSEVQGTFESVGCFIRNQTVEKRGNINMSDVSIHATCQRKCIQSNRDYFALSWDEADNDVMACLCTRQLSDRDNSSGCPGKNLLEWFMGKNECLNSPCGDAQTCHNTREGFTCLCPDGYDVAGSECKKIPYSHVGCYNYSEYFEYINVIPHSDADTHEACRGKCDERMREYFALKQTHDDAEVSECFCLTRTDLIEVIEVQGCTYPCQGKPCGGYTALDVFSGSNTLLRTLTPESTSMKPIIASRKSVAFWVWIVVAASVLFMTLLILAPIITMGKRTAGTSRTFSPPSCAAEVENHLLPSGLTDDSPKTSDTADNESDAAIKPMLPVTRIKTEDFTQTLRVRLNEENILSDEFDNLPYEPSKPWDTASKTALKTKNRFTDILPYDENRVKLSVMNDDPLTDYINASYIQGYLMDVTFIACIGPTVFTITDFWRMVWEQDIRVIAMVTKLVEGGKNKCMQYWPDSGGDIYGLITVHLLSEDVWPEYTLRKFRVIDMDKEERLVSHFHYTAWPDKGVPVDGTSLLNFRKKINKAMIPNKPTAIHCSAGVGRTGTLISLDSLLRQAETEGEVDVFACVSKLREQRVYMVQTLEQYAFIYKTLALYFTVGETTMSGVEFDKQVAILAKPDDGGFSKFQQQFNILIAITFPIDEESKTIALSTENKHKNRYHNILPFEDRRVHLRGPTDTDYINAVFVDSYQNVNGFMATQIPLLDTILDYWRMVVDQGCGTILVVVKADQEQSTPEYLPSLETPIEVQGRRVALLSTDASDGIKIFNIAIEKDVQSDEIELVFEAENCITHKVKVFLVSLTGDEDLIPSATTIALYSSVHRWQQQTRGRPILATCLNGATFCGQYIACHNLLSMLNLEQEVDIFQVVRQIKRCRPEFINTMDQYQMLYDLVGHYKKMFDDYANFQ